MWHRKRDLGQVLRENRPAPADEFLRLAVGKVQAESGAPASGRDRHAMARPLFTLAAGCAVVLAFALLGGFSGLKTSVKQNAHLSPFLAASDTYCTIVPTINQASDQVDPTSTSPVHFTADFGQDVSGFDASDLIVTSSAGGSPTVNVTGGPQTYDVAIGGLTTDTVITASIKQGAATNTTLDCPTDASTSTDNSVTFTTLNITSYTRSGGSGNASFNGLGGIGAGVITVKVCATNDFPTCTAVTTAQTGNSPGAAWQTNVVGTFTVGTTYYAQATQGSRVSPVFSFKFGT
jgi:hypothetical protein